MTEAVLINSTVLDATLRGVNLTKANLTGSTLQNSDLSNTILVDTILNNTNLNNCRVYGIAAWNVRLVGANQSDLIVSPSYESSITVENLEIAQFIYLLLDNQKIRNVINTITSKAVLILGRFTPGRKAILDAIRKGLRQQGFVPIIFDFEQPTNKDFTETIMTLAGLCLFIVADITNPKSSPLELQAVVPNYMTPFVPIIEEGEEPFSMFKDLKGKFDWVLDPLVYDSATNLLKVIRKAVVKPALQKHDEITTKKFEQLRTRHIKDYM